MAERAIGRTPPTPSPSTPKKTTLRVVLETWWGGGEGGDRETLTHKGTNTLISCHTTYHSDTIFCVRIGITYFPQLFVVFHDHGEV